MSNAKKKRTEKTNVTEQVGELPTQTAEAGWKRKTPGWRFSILLFATSTCLVLIINVSVAIYAVSQYGWKPRFGFKPVFTGDCNKTKRINTILHLVINILSSILLSGSNYSMQVLTAPYRDQIDKAHSKRTWLDIGVQSVRNLKALSCKWKLFWWLFAFSSVPLHLFYNSIFSQSWTRQAYVAALVNEDFIEGGSFDAGWFERRYSGGRHLLEDIQANASLYEKLDVLECVKAYDKKALLDRKHVMVVTTTPRQQVTSRSSYAVNATLPNGRINSLYALEVDESTFASWPPSSWMCPTSEKCNPTEQLARGQVWHPFSGNVTVEYCLSNYIGEKCTLDFSFGLIIIVSLCNLVKFCCMILVWSNDPGSSLQKPVLTVGDAVCSFLDAPDQETSGVCLANKWYVKSNWIKQTQETPRSLIWEPQPFRWCLACGRWRWISFYILSGVTVILSVFLLKTGLNSSLGTSYDSEEWLQSGFGVANIEQDAKFVAFDDDEQYKPDSLISNIILANLPQLIVSFVFLLYNNILTSMTLAKEWSDFAYDRKTLRVSNPSGIQRGTYFLQLPYRYAVPLLLGSIILHWLISQALFLDRRVVASIWWGIPYTESLRGSVATVGYSPLAVLVALIWGIVMVLALVAMGFRRYKPGIPLVGSCSAAISAACHPDPSEGNITRGPLLWGVISPEGVSIGHCSFSSKDVVLPESGRQYA
ncbi:hypothetical protein BKA66DRAFT_500046 [Pyrenochaeta sp. MPI-SDFR-AT-0127]|nr:hypothetical protein BKA66DRAFT_500046 [Pyrenochaeta sp. MPI-SDFR-AT-0127]